MKVQDLVKKPTLTKLTLDDEETVTTYGEPLDFYTLQPFPLSLFMKFQLRDYKDFNATVEVLKEVILDETSKPVLTEDNVLPLPVLLKIITKITTELGK